MSRTHIILWTIAFLFSGCGITFISILFARVRKKRKGERQKRELERKKEWDLLTEAQKKLWGKSQSDFRSEVIIPTVEEVTEFSEQKFLVEAAKEELRQLWEIARKGDVTFHRHYPWAQLAFAHLYPFCLPDSLRLWRRSSAPWLSKAWILCKLLFLLLRKNSW